ncbi:beta-propeller fold lactonase family protein [Litorilinea aerophila]|uniref:Beta-propeller fold lactonase family protein n=1 Tax=Litorilinea aerophila TaxID=1204385 RepID=A0A540VHY2_9CHLR|nr:beta-propeller fold lactonase family protein [Litorilinea aerophila]MCC9076022.1 beta-propeller fold lactonase family protein [Litorilinea aerophila]
MNLRSVVITGVLALSVPVLAACGGLVEPTASPPAAVEGEQAGAAATEAATAVETTASEAAGVETPQPAGFSWTAWVANGMDDSLSVVDLATGQELARIPVGMNPHILTTSPDGSILYVVNAGGHDRDPNAHAEEAASQATPDPHGHGGNGADTAPSAEAGKADEDKADSSMDQPDGTSYSLWAIDAASGQVLVQVPVGMGPTHPIASADGSRVYVTNTDEGSVTVIDTATWGVVTTISDLPEPHDGALTPDGRLLYLATAGTSTLTVVDTESFAVIKTIPVGNKPRGLVAGGVNGELAYVTNKGDGTLSIVDIPNGTVQMTVPVGAGAHAVRLSPDGETAYVSLSQEDAVALVDVQSGQVRRTLAVGATPEQLDLSGDGRWLVVSNNGDATLSIIDLAQETLVATVAVGAGAYGVQMTSVAYAGSTPMALPDLPKNADGYRDLSVEQLAAAMEAKDFVLVNVHIPYEGELPNTDLFIPYNEIGANLDKLSAPDAPIVLYCRSGRMSTAAAEVLVAAGYTNIYELDGGFNAWQAAGYELVSQ